MMRTSSERRRGKVVGTLLLVTSLLSLIGGVVATIVRIDQYPALGQNAVPLRIYVSLTVVAFLIPTVAFSASGLVILLRTVGRQQPMSRS
jgi:hypothetical protein